MKILKAPKIKKISPASTRPQNPMRVLQDMVNVAKTHNGIGLAANQVGVDWRCFVMHASLLPESVRGIQLIESDWAAIEQPFFGLDVEVGDVSYVREEGCLSVPGYSLPIRRVDTINVSWIDPTTYKEFNGIVLDDLAARVFQHEIDHLYGSCIVDKALNLNRDSKRRIMKELMK